MPKKKKKITLEMLQKKHQFNVPLSYYFMGAAGDSEAREQKAFAACLMAEFPEELGRYELDGEEVFPLMIVSVADFFDPQARTKSKGGRFSTKMGKYRKMGYQRYSPDMVLLVPRWDFSGFVVEMKSLVGNASKGQRMTLNVMESRGYVVHICRGFAEALNMWLEYIHS